MFLSLLNPKFLGALAVVVLVFVSINWHSGRVDDTFRAGYDSRVAEEREAAGKVQDVIEKVETVENDKAIELEKMLAQSRERSEKLAAQIRDAKFKCGDIGPSFVELFNEGTFPGN